MESKSFCCSSYEQLQIVLSNYTDSESAFTPTLAIVFCSVKQDLEQLRKTFLEKGIDLVGCTTAGEIVNIKLHEHAIAVLLMDMDPTYYKIELAEYKNGDVFTAAKTLGQFINTSFERPSVFLLSGGLGIDAESIVEGINSKLGKKIPIYGGLAGDDLEMKKTFAFTKDLVTDNGIVILSIDTDKIEITGLAISGWQPVGSVNVITKIKGNIVYEINNEPAYDVFSRYFGITDLDSPYDQLINIQTNYPFQIIRNQEQSILRSPLLVDAEERTITLAARVPEGTSFRFSTSPGFEVIEETLENYKQFSNQVSETDALILFSCKGRHGAFGPMIEDEIEGIYHLWEKPLIGFLTYGEFGNIGNGGCEFHNETCVLVSLCEK